MNDRQLNKPVNLCQRNSAFFAWVLQKKVLQILVADVSVNIKVTINAQYFQCIQLFRSYHDTGICKIHRHVNKFSTKLNHPPQSIPVQFYQLNATPFNPFEQIHLRSSTKIQHEAGLCNYRPGGVILIRMFPDNIYSPTMVGIFLLNKAKLALNK
jgi:hypothetical protein